MIYQWRGRNFKSNANEAGKLFKSMAEEGRLNAHEVVDESRPEDAILHKDFEWDDWKAAELYREEQARSMIRCISVAEVEETDGIEDSEVKKAIVSLPRNFYNIKPEEEGCDNTYEPIEVIMESESKIDQLLAQAKNEARMFRVKYAMLESQLKGIFNAISDFLDDKAL